MLLKLPAIKAEIFTDEFLEECGENEKKAADIFCKENFLAAEIVDDNLILVVTVNLFPADKIENKSEKAWRRNSFFLNKRGELVAQSHCVYSDVMELVNDLPLCTRRELVMKFIEK